MEAGQEMTCPRLRNVPGSADSLVRFVVGRPEDLRPLDAAAIAEFGDPLAGQLFAKGVFPKTAEEVTDALDAALPEGDRLRAQMTFVVGERSQLPAGITDAARPGIRGFLVTRGNGLEGPDLILSAIGAPTTEFIEVLAWDETLGGFNYYTTDADAPWVFAGNSADALSEDTSSLGPFEAHPSGNPIMKELRRPWVHWESIDESVSERGVPAEVASHRWFEDKVGAEVLETQAMILAIERWNRVRLERAVEGDEVRGLKTLMRSFLGTPTVNLASSLSESEDVIDAGEDFQIPAAFLANVHCLRDVIGLPQPADSQLRISGPTYREILADNEVTLRQDGTALVDPPRDTHFVFLVPEPAFEDTDIVKKVVEAGLLSRQVAACLLMVDFPNPVFSERREALLEHIPDTAPSDALSDTIANAITQAPQASEEGTAEREFAELLAVGVAFEAEFSKLLTDYYAAASAGLSQADRLGEFVRLAESRRERSRSMFIVEDELVFAKPAVAVPAGLRMVRDGSIV
ncbi:MAG: hypothetical protein M3355_07540 [Actinomycetota bacterium]|nr:hypothetical protein [Actinomycetota bacterium]